MAEAASESDDFAAEPVPDAARTGWQAMFFAILGIATSLFNMQIVSVIATSFGSKVALCAIAYGSAVAMLLGRILVSNAIRTGFGLGLFARRVLGYRGASLFSLIFGVASLVFFSAEAVIMAASLKGLVGNISSWIVLPAVAMIVVPLVWFGMKVLARFQLATFLLYAVLLAAALYFSLRAPPGAPDWLNYLPRNAPPFGTGLLTAIGIANGSVFATVLITADYARYVRRDEHRGGTWWVGVGFQFVAFGLEGLLGLWFATRYVEPNPGVYFVTVLGAWGIVFAIATQLRINIANMYSGSLAFVNMFHQALDVRVSRHLVVLLFGIVASIGLVLDLIQYLMLAMNVIGMFLLCFSVLLLTDLYLVRPVRPALAARLPYRVGTLADWRMSAVSSTVVATLVGGVLISGYAGSDAERWASFAAGISQFVLYLAATAIAGGGKDGPRRSPPTTSHEPAA